MRIIVYHREYGCDTGCCGHTVEIKDGPEPERKDGGWSNFSFYHPYEDTEEAKIKYAQNLIIKMYGEEHVKDLDWANCMVVDD